MTRHFCSANAKKFGTYGPKKIQRYRCSHCGKTFTTEEKMDGMYTSVEDAVKVIALLCEGVGINAASRLTGMNKETVLKVLVQAGERCAKLMDQRMRDLAIGDVQCDEIWTFVGKKQSRVTATDNADVVGDFFTFVAIGRDSKLIISSLVGKRTIPYTNAFMADLADRITGDVQISTDSFGAYRGAVRRAFGPEIDYGQATKIFSKNPHGKHSDTDVVAVVRAPISGAPIISKISTCHVERNNLTMRTFMRRLTRLCLGFSKKAENLKAAVALYFAHYNFCRVHSAVKMTPAMAAGITNRTWTLGELIAQ